MRDTFYQFFVLIVVSLQIGLFIFSYFGHFGLPSTKKGSTSNHPLHWLLEKQAPDCLVEKWENDNLKIRVTCISKNGLKISIMMFVGRCKQICSTKHCYSFRLIQFDTWHLHCLTIIKIPAVIRFIFLYLFVTWERWILMSRKILINVPKQWAH